MRIIKKSRVLINIATELAKSKFFDKAIALIQDIENSDKPETLATIVTELAKNKFFDKAIILAQNIFAKNSLYKSKALIIIVTELAKSKLFDKATMLAQNIRCNYYKSKALVIIATELNKNNFFDKAQKYFDKALACAKNIEDFRKSEALIMITTKLAKNKFFDKALTAAQNIRDHEKRDTLALIAIELAKNKSFNKAIELTQNIRSSFWESETLVTIATELANNKFFDKAQKYFDEALAIADTFNEDYMMAKSQILPIIIKLAKYKFFDKAILSAQDILENYRKSSTLAKVAIELVKHDNGFKIFNKIQQIYLYLKDQERERFLEFISHYIEKAPFKTKDYPYKIYQAIQEAEKYVYKETSSILP